MRPETEQLLGTLEVLIDNPCRTFVWETEEQGEFNVWNLAIAEGFVSLTDVDVAIAHWQAVERWRTPKNQSKNDSPHRNERQGGGNTEIETARTGLYQQLSQFLKVDLLSLQAFNLSVFNRQDRYEQWNRPRFCFYIIIGQIDDRDWICLSQTVPDQIHCNSSIQANQVAIKPLLEKTLNWQSQGKSILSQLLPITIDGEYYGAYNYTYSHQIVYASASQKSSAIELALQAAGMLTVKKTNVEYTSQQDNRRKLSQFFNALLSERTIYTLSFWDICYTYEVGQAPTGDWLAVRSIQELDFNP